MSASISCELISLGLVALEASPASEAVSTVVVASSLRSSELSSVSTSASSASVAAPSSATFEVGTGLATLLEPWAALLAIAVVAEPVEVLPLLATLAAGFVVAGCAAGLWLEDVTAGWLGAGWLAAGFAAG
jgi:hypothetical protein